MAEGTREAASVAVEKEEVERNQINIVKRQKRRLVKSEVISPDLVFADSKLLKQNPQYIKIPVKQNIKVATRPASS